MQVKSWLRSAAKELAKVGIKSHKLDSEIILAHTLKQPRTYLHAHDDEQLTDRQLEIANARLDLRLDRVPIAYIIGHKDFYGRQFKVTSATLIPRPESEVMIELLKKYVDDDFVGELVDVGTGSGVLGITAKLERPKLEVTLVDISKQALHVAEINATSLKVDVQMLVGNLLAAHPTTPDIILANLPYVDKSWERSPETNHEPPQALFADKNGLQLIEKLITQAASRCDDGCLMFLEADPYQHTKITSHAKKHRFKLREIEDYILVFEKI